MFQVLIGILTINPQTKTPNAKTLFQVLIGILTIENNDIEVRTVTVFQVLIGILTILYKIRIRRIRFYVSSPYRYSNNKIDKVVKKFLTVVSSPYRYSNNLPLRVIMTPAFVFQVLIGILTIPLSSNKSYEHDQVSSPYRYSNNKPIVNFKIQFQDSFKSL